MARMIHLHYDLGVEVTYLAHKYSYSQFEKIIPF